MGLGPAWPQLANWLPTFFGHGPQFLSKPERPCSTSVVRFWGADVACEVAVFSPVHCIVKRWCYVRDMDSCLLGIGRTFDQRAGGSSSLLHRGSVDQCYGFVGACHCRRGILAGLFRPPAAGAQPAELAYRACGSGLFRHLQLPWCAAAASSPCLFSTCLFFFGFLISVSTVFSRFAWCMRRVTPLSDARGSVRICS